MFSFREGHVHVVQELLSRGANVNAATKVRSNFTMIKMLIYSLFVFDYSILEG